jgi:hypothetical protein
MHTGFTSRHGDEWLSPPVRVRVGASGGDERLFVSHIVLCELVWVLRGAYGRPKDDVLAALVLVDLLCRGDHHAAHRRPGSLP